jgi:hypothetical protein
MGLDMYAYAAAKEGEQAAFNQGSKWDAEKDDMVNPIAPAPREIAYWRKHPNLHGWMERLAKSKNVEYGSFNGVELELTWADIDALEQAVTHKKLPATTGFFFGSDADELYYQDDLAFIKAARAELFLGLRVFYNSSW